LADQVTNRKRYCTSMQETHWIGRFCRAIVRRLCVVCHVCVFYQNESIKQSIDQSLFAQLATETAMQNKADARGQDSETYSTDHCPKSKNK